MSQDPLARQQLEQTLEGKPEALRDVSQGILKLIRSALPQVEERLNPWRMYSFVGRGHFCYLAVSSRHVSLGFLQGTSLQDPGGLLEGTGKYFRHVKFRAVEDLERPGLRELIAQAVDLDKSGS